MEMKIIIPTSLHQENYTLVDNEVSSKYLIKSSSTTKINEQNIKVYNDLMVVSCIHFQLVVENVNNSKKNKQKKSEVEKKELDEYCSNCGNVLSLNNKYICIVCIDYYLCSKCEKEHFHPLIKCKDKKITSLNDIGSYLKCNNQLPELKENKTMINKFFEKKLQLKISSYTNSISMRPNSKINFLLEIENISKANINKNEGLYLISNNCKDVIIYNTKINTELKSKEKTEIEIGIESPNICKIVNLNILIYAANSSMKIESNIFQLTIEINEDKEDEELNNYFSKYPQILFLDKIKKKNIKFIMEENFTKYHPYMIKSVLEKYNWELNNAVMDIVEMNDKDKEYLPDVSSNKF